MGLEPPRARYRQVADELRDAIKRGEFAPDTALPSQPELARRYGLNQTSINRAIAILRAEGLVRVEHGRGAFVQDVPTVKRVRRMPRAREGGSSFAHEMRQASLEPSTELVQAGPVTPPPEVAERLNIGEDAKTVIRKRHMFASGRPVQLATSYIPVSIAGGPEIAEPDVGPTGIYARLAERGHRPARFVEEVELRIPTEEEADFLRVTETQPVLEVVRIVHDADDRPLEACVNVLAGQQWRLTYEWPAEQ